MQIMTFPGAGKTTLADMTAAQHLPVTTEIVIPAEAYESDETLDEYIETALRPKHLDGSENLVFDYDKRLSDGMLRLGVNFTLVRPNYNHKEQYLARIGNDDHRQFMDDNWERIFAEIMMIHNQVEIDFDRFLSDVV